MATSAQLAEKARKDRATLEPSAHIPPQLPPRTNTVPAPPPYSSEDAGRSKLISEQWRSEDPRRSSTHSLIASEQGQDDRRRTLLLVYIHGFMGNETSFQSFPAHIHNLLTITLHETHVVHTKIYPRYKSRKAIEFAREDFSTWLEPHENHHTDVVLLGHSMGGILSAEVALKAPNSPATGRAFHHRILGTVNFDTPFLGMHPGVISSGIGSLFRPAPEPPGSKPNQPSNAGSDTAYGSSQGSTSLENQALSTSEWDASSQLSAVQSMASQLSSPSPGDPFFDPPFPNDVRREQRKGWPNFLHFINKHSENLATATMNYFMSHVEFGGCLADYPRLKNRCDRLRALEDVDELVDLDSLGYRSPIRRIRFVNYYTASSGRPKAPKMASEQLVDEDEHLTPIEVEMKDMSLDHPGSISWTPTSSSSVQGQTDNDIRPPEQPCNEQDTSPIQVQEQSPGDRLEVQETLQELPEMRYIDSIPIDDDYDPPVEAAIINSIETSSSDLPPDLESISLEPGLPPIPEIPVEPESIDLNLYTDKDSRKIAEKEQKRVMRVYQQAVKDRESAIKDRKKLLEKREKKARQEREKTLKAEEKERLKVEKEDEKRKTTINPPPRRERQSSMASSSSMQDNRPKKDKKFCMLPPKHGGNIDKCWVRVYMEGVDEVGAHCGLFSPGPQYESLVGDVGARIESWVQEDARRRTTLKAQGQE